MAKVKGVILDSARAFVMETAPASAWDQVLSAFPEELARQVRASVTVGWYDLDLYVRLLGSVLKGITQEFFREDRSRG